MKRLQSKFMVLQYHTALIGVFFCLFVLGSSELAVAEVPSAPPPAQSVKQKSADNGLRQFLRLSAPDRLKLVQNIVGEQAFSKVVRDNLTLTISARGQVEAVTSADVVCQVKQTAKNAFGTKIRWLVDDGTIVKRGQLIAQLDDSVFRTLFAEQQKRLEAAKMDLERAKVRLQQITEEHRIDIKLAEIAVRQAELKLKLYKGNSNEDRELLALEGEKASLMVEKVKLRGHADKAIAEANVDESSTSVAKEEEKLEKINDQIAQCMVFSPIDGYVGLNNRALGRIGRGERADPLIAVGEHVVHGQIMMQVIDLTAMKVVTKIPESLIHKVQVGHAAMITIDALPDVTRKANVTEIAKLPSAEAWQTSGVKVYDTELLFIDKIAHLKPGMSAQVNIVTGDRAGVLQVPKSAVIQMQMENNNTQAPRPACIVRTNNGLEMRTVEIGESGSTNLEIRSGLVEGDVIVRDPATVLQRLGFGKVAG